MNILADIITYVRRLIKTPSNAVITDALIIDYINRFWINDVDARIQLFDLKTKYQFETQPAVDQYNMPMYDIQIETEDPQQEVSFYPVYQGFFGPAYINGIEVAFQTYKPSFYNYYPNFVQYNSVVAVGDGTTDYSFTLPVLANSVPPNPPYQGILRGHVDMAGIVATGVNQDPPLGSNLNFNIPSTSILGSFFLTSVDSLGRKVVVQDSGQFLNTDVNYGLLMSPGTAPFGYSALTNPIDPPNPYTTTSNTVNYLTGEVNVNFPVSIPAGTNISAQYYLFQTGLPRSIFYYNNVITLRSPPDRSYLVELDAYLTPAAFFSTDQAIPFSYMSEYIARGAARKILSDTGDWEQFNQYEPLFREQEMLVWKRSQRQVTANRVPTIYSAGFGGLGLGNSNGGFT